jgi:hypothetical protein
MLILPLFGLTTSVQLGSGVADADDFGARRDATGALISPARFVARTLSFVPVMTLKACNAIIGNEDIRYTDDAGPAIDAAPPPDGGPNPPPCYGYECEHPCYGYDCGIYGYGYGP